MKIHLILLFLGLSTLAFSQKSKNFNSFPKNTESVFYQIQDGTNFYKYNPKKKNYTEIKKDKNRLKVNAAGFNTKDNFIYGIKMGTTNLIKISADGKFKDLGAVKGLNRRYGDYICGDFDTDGNLYVYNGIDAPSLYKINIKTMTAKAINKQKNNAKQPRLGDFSFLPNKNKFYGVSQNNELISIDAKSGALSNLGSIAGLKNKGSVFGASYSDSNGALYCFHNKTGDLYRINVDKKTALLIQSTNILLKTNDGASSVFEEIKLKSCDESLREALEKVEMLEGQIITLKKELKSAYKK